MTDCPYIRLDSTTPIGKAAGARFDRIQDERAALMRSCRDSHIGVFAMFLDAERLAEDSGQSIRVSLSQGVDRLLGSQHIPICRRMDIALAIHIAYGVIVGACARGEAGIYDAIGADTVRKLITKVHQSFLDEHPDNLS